MMNKSQTYKTKMGGCFSLVEIIVIIAFMSQLFIDLANKKVTYTEQRYANLAKNDGKGYSEIPTGILDFSL